ncbi:protein tyrosine phosphatase type IVA 2-like [Synchiropus picturatus]
MSHSAPVEINYNSMKLLITHNPTDAQLVSFVEGLKALSITTLVRVCVATYDKKPVEEEGIQVLDWPFDDGSAPPDHVVDDWLGLLQTQLRSGSCRVAVHCVAGLGRAPVLVALALMEGGMQFEDAVQYIRQRRRGAFSSRQLLFLQNYRAKHCLRPQKSRRLMCTVQ